MKKLILFPFCMMTLLVSNLTQANSTQYSPQIAIGSYNQTQNLDLLLEQAVILHHNENDSWSTATLPWINTPEESRINDSFCQENNCIAAPYNSYQYGTSMPFFLMSHDGGMTWNTNYNLKGLPHDIKNGEPISLYCKDKMCLSSGWYETTNDSGTARMLLTSYNSGQSWSFSSLPQPPSGGYGSYLKPVTCLDNACLIGVSYFSIDKGATWSTSHITGVPSHDSIEIYDVQCNSTVCIADGTYDNKLLLLMSKDKGQNWKFIPKTDTPANKYMNINDFIYSNGYFILVGGYYSPSLINKGFVLSSNDNGKSWIWVEDMVGTDHNKLYPLRSISCTDNTCIAGGDNNAGFNFIRSHDNGLSWEAVPTVTSMKETPSIDTIQCQENTCTTFGYFYNNEYDNHIHPISLESHDKGETWIVNKNIINFPEHLGELRFSDIK